MSEDKKNLEGCKFSVNDLVLCYEPDPLKAKVLYDAKILDKDVTIDDNSRKAFEYYIHFQGWNKSWDRWVLEDQILRINDTNRGLQAKLYENARKKKKPRKCDNESTDDEKSEASSTSGSSSNSDEVKSSQLPLVSLDIPKVIAVRLEDDCYNIKRKKKLVHLPRSPTVNDILNDYYAHYLMIVKTSAGRDTNINLVREVIYGLNTYFNFYVFSLLLYNFERDQYHKFFPPGKENQPENLIATSPLLSPSKNKIKNIDIAVESPKPTILKTIIDDGRSSPLLKEALKTNSRRRKSSIFDEVFNATSPSKRKRNASIASITSDSKDSTLSVQEIKVKTDSKQNRIVERQSVRLEVKNNDLSKKDVVNKVNNYLNNEPLSPLENNSNGLRRSNRSQRLPSSNGENDEHDTLPIGSTAKTLQTTRQKKKRNFKVKTLPIESDDKSYIEFPRNLLGNTPADVYGLEHLLRLFVKLPILLSCTSVEENKMNVIIQYVTKILDYLSKRSDLFVDQAIVYSESII